MDALISYESSAIALGVLAAVILLQLLIADVAGIRARHTPGTPVDGGHESFHFRAVRAHANSGESLGVLILFVLAAVGVQVDPTWLMRSLWAIVFLRLLYTLCYYFDWRALRSAVFGLILLAIASLGLLVALKVF